MIGTYFGAGGCDGFARERAFVRLTEAKEKAAGMPILPLWVILMFDFLSKPLPDMEADGFAVLAEIFFVVLAFDFLILNRDPFDGAFFLRRFLKIFGGEFLYVIELVFGLFAFGLP